MARLEWKLNLIRELFWYVVPAMGAILISHYIDLQFLPIGDVASIVSFRAGIIVMVVVAWIFAFLWWRVANIHIKSLAWLRRHMERYSFLDSLIPILCVYLAATILYFRNPYIIHQDLMHRYRLNCIYAIPTLFSLTMYALPPRQISRVIIPGPEAITLFLRGVVTLLLAATTFWQFGINFLW